MDRKDVARIVKVKAKAGQVQVAWESAAGDEYDVRFRASLNAELSEALGGLVTPVAAWLELPDEYTEGLSAIGVTYTYKEGAEGAVITLRKDLKMADAPLILNTPHAPREAYSEGGQCLPADISAALDRVHAAAVSWLTRPPDQMSLFEQGQKGDAPTVEMSSGGRIVDLTPRMHRN